MSGLSYLTDCDPEDETPLICDFCSEESSELTKRYDFDGRVEGLECETCAEREPWEAYYEGGAVRHELQGASGLWNR
jgi:hypothetical protein